MKSAHLVAALSLGSLLAACNSLDSPLSNVSNLSHLGHDARVYNSNTNSWDWPDDSAEARKREKERKAQLLAAMKATPAGTPASTVRPGYYDPLKGVTVKTVPSGSADPKFTPFPVAQRVTPPPAPKNGTGYFNPETGKIEWTTDGRPPKKVAAATPAKKAKATPAQAANFSSDPALAPGSTAPARPANNPAPSGNGAPLFPQ